jgi:hypothetical protein
MPTLSFRLCERGGAHTRLPQITATNDKRCKPCFVFQGSDREIGERLAAITPAC